MENETKPRTRHARRISNSQNESLSVCRSTLVTNGLFTTPPPRSLFLSHRAGEPPLAKASPQNPTNRRSLEFRRVFVEWSTTIDQTLWPLASDFNFFNLTDCEILRTWFESVVDFEDCRTINFFFFFFWERGEGLFYRTPIEFQCVLVYINFCFC